MKKVFLFLIAIAFTQTVFAKKVKFSVDMFGLTTSSLGIHVMGDFQIAAGYTLDFAPNLTTLTQQGTSTIYSIIVNIPAFRKYEYKFVNGDQSYEAEFVPNEARVGYLLNDNRWMYLDSLKNDTTDVGAVLFSGNAPAGKSLIRFLVDMSSAGTVSNKGVHVAGNFQAAGFNATTNYMYSFVTGVYEVITYTTNGTYQFKHYNGNTTGNGEVLPGWCTVSGNRPITVTKDTVLPALCFNSCSTCAFAGIKEISFSQKLKLYPNPTNSSTTLELAEAGNYSAELTNVLGQSLRSYSIGDSDRLTISKNDLPAGVYYLSLSSANGEKATTKLVIE